ncbi:MAG: ABC-type uncharacterized transport system fused permease/ATPase subunit [Alphaproteobacteria bacterium]|jgi:ABC-type uncharacterized transport system fused permease/ATPase subunit
MTKTVSDIILDKNSDIKEQSSSLKIGIKTTLAKNRPQNIPTKIQETLPQYWKKIVKPYFTKPSNNYIPDILSLLQSLFSFGSAATIAGISQYPILPGIDNYFTSHQDSKDQTIDELVQHSQKAGLSALGYMGIDYVASGIAENASLKFKKSFTEHLDQQISEVAMGNNHFLTNKTDRDKHFTIDTAKIAEVTSDATIGLTSNILTLGGATAVLATTISPAIAAISLGMSLGVNGLTSYFDNKSICLKQDVRNNFVDINKKRQSINNRIDTIIATGAMNQEKNALTALIKKQEVLENKERKSYSWSQGFKQYSQAIMPLLPVLSMIKKNKISGKNNDINNNPIKNILSEFMPNGQFDIEAIKKSINVLMASYFANFMSVKAVNDLGDIVKNMPSGLRQIKEFTYLINASDKIGDFLKKRPLTMNYDENADSIMINNMIFAPPIADPIARKSVRAVVDTVLNSEKICAKNVSLVLPKGRFYYLSGESGAGKSQFLQAIVGDNLFSSGNITLPYKKEDIKTVTQQILFPDNVTLLEAIAYPNKVQDGMDKKVTDMMGKIGLEGLAPRLYEKNENWSQALSGGQAKRIAFITALLAKPKLLILDETISNIDYTNKVKMWSLLQEQMDKDATVIFTDHETLPKEIKLSNKTANIHIDKTNKTMIFNAIKEIAS